MSYSIEVSHTIDAGHRVLGHTKPDGTPGKCARLHGHTYAFDIEIVGQVLVEPGFVVDFADVKRILDEWDHQTLLWEIDPCSVIDTTGSYGTMWDPGEPAGDDFGVVRLPFNPTAENMAEHLALRFLREFDSVSIVRVVVRETAKTKASVTRVRADLRPEEEETMVKWPSRLN